jgi:xanthine dehydrogenase accessory factor
MAEHEPLDSALAWARAGEPVAVATVTRTWGSAPRPSGSQMFVRGDGLFAGSVSGGCVEAAVIGESQAALSDGRIRNLSFGIANEDAWAVGLACGGTIEIHVTPLAAEEASQLLGAVAQARDDNRPLVWATDLNDPRHHLIDPAAAPDSALGQAAREAALHDRSGAAQANGAGWFLTVFNPALDLVVIGAVHIAQPLVEIARIAGHAVRVIDPRARFAADARFPGLDLIRAWPDEALAAAPLTARSAMVALTHDPKVDDPALAAALRSPAFYVGALGSRQTHARRLERLKAQGFSAEAVARIRGPIGLNIGARSPAEIAIAILAEITRDLRENGEKNSRAV